MKKKYTKDETDKILIVCNHYRANRHRNACNLLTILSGFNQCHAIIIYHSHIFKTIYHNKIK